MADHDTPFSPAEAYESFYVPAMFAPLARRVLAQAAPKPGEAMLDLACGTGIVARLAAPLLGPEGRITALDLRPGMLAAARAIPAPDGAPIDWVEGDATALDLPDGAFDLVVCQQGLQFFADRAKALAEMRRVLKPGGRVAIALWHEIARQGAFGDLAPIERRRLESLGIDASDIDLPFSLGDIGELKTLLDRAGFGDVGVVEVAIDTSFPAENFVENVEFAYSAVVPDFVADPAAFHRFAADVAADADAILARYTVGDRVRFPMHANIGIGTA